MDDVMTIVEPATKDVIETAMVVVSTKSTSCVVELKHAGRPLLDADSSTAVVLLAGDCFLSLSWAAMWSQPLLFADMLGSNRSP